MAVSELPLPAQLLFTWMIAHTDDEGRLKGEPKYIKATVVPLTNWPIKRINDYLLLMESKGLIYYWEQNNEWFIEFVKWGEYQSIPKDRFKPSKLPSFSNRIVNNSETNCVQTENILSPQYNTNEDNINITETNISENNPIEELADENTYKEEEVGNPYLYPIANEGEQAAFEVWEFFEKNNPKSFYTTYLTAHKRGLPAFLIYQFQSEIKQDSSISIPGAVFNKKVNNYFAKLEAKNGVK